VGLADATGFNLRALASPSGAPIASLYDLIEKWDAISTNLLPVGGVPEEHIDSVEVLAPLTGRDVLAVGKNYKDHAK
jgi:2-keto-4-pentenoate hydratase/2-oxohepta-3-ene-1,7-dioic acid hydratase in catechol pathway